MVFALCLLLSPDLWAQELVPNPGFEEHRKFCEDCHVYNHTVCFDYLKDWKVSGIGGALYCNTVYDTPFQKGIRCCWPHDEPYSGVGMAGLRYIEACPFEGDTGCATYIHARLETAMQVGEVYEVKMWVYVPQNKAAEQSILANIGIYLSRRPEHLPAHTLLETPYYFSTQVVPDTWTQVHHYVRALCEMQFVTIGAIKDENWPQRHLLIQNMVYFFIDDVSVRRINEDTLDSSIEPTPYCEYFEKQEKINAANAPQDTSVYFETGSAELDDHDKAVLDSFYELTMGNGTNCFILSGHTDSRGEEHHALSVARATAVQEYLIAQYTLSEYKFIVFPMGESDPLGDNRTESGRTENRRVTIRNSNIPTHAAVYRKGLYFLDSGEYGEALRMFRIWLHTMPEDRKMLVLHDPRVQMKLPDSHMPALVVDVKKSYVRRVRPDHAFFLDSLYFLDQRYRLENPMAATRFIPELDTFTRGRQMDWDGLEKWDSINAVLLLKYLEQHPFPKISEVGRRPVRAACLVIQHLADTAVFDKYLPLLEKRCIEGEAEWKYYALMYDRNEITSGRPQIYGTQRLFTDETRALTKLAPVDNMDLVNLRRRKFGMHPVHE